MNTKPEEHAELLRRLDEIGVFSEQQIDSPRSDIAADLNVLMYHANWSATFGQSHAPSEFAEAVLRLVAYVAHREEIEREK